MTRKRKPKPDDSASDGIWINPRLNLRGPDGNRAWEMNTNITPTAGSRFLELADIAFGHKKSHSQKKKPMAVSTHHRGGAKSR